jgi:alpha-1,2-mannosyltransferase
MWTGGWGFLWVAWEVCRCYAPPVERVATPLGSRRWAVATVAAWVVALGVAVQSAGDYLTRPLYDRLVDLHVYVLAVTALVHGRSLYTLHPGEGAPFTYPPFAGAALFALALVPEPVTRAVWTALTLGAVSALTWIVTRRLPRRLGPASVVWPLLTALVLASKPLQSNLRFGQISIFLVLAVVTDVVVLDGRRWQGGLTGLAAAVKLTPLVFVPYLWLIGRRRAAGVAAACFALATALGAVVAPGDSRTFWTSTVLHETRGLPLAETGNQSIYAVALRAGLHGVVLVAIWLGLSAVLGCWGLWRSREAWRANQPLLSLAMAGCVSLLLSPISWTHHQVWILLGAAGVFTAASWADLAIASAIVVPMMIGLPGVHALGPPGRWLSDNHRTVLEVLIACVLPFRRREAGPAPEPLPAGRSGEVPASRGDRGLPGGAQGAGLGVPGGSRQAGESDQVHAEHIPP